MTGRLIKRTRSESKRFWHQNIHLYTAGWHLEQFLGFWGLCCVYKLYESDCNSFTRTSKITKSHGITYFPLDWIYIFFSPLMSYLAEPNKVVPSVTKPTAELLWERNMELKRMPLSTISASRIVTKLLKIKLTWELESLKDRGKYKHTEICWLQSKWLSVL